MVPGRIIVVDDSDDARVVMVEMLASWGYDAVPAASAEEALELVKSLNSIDLVVTDIVMPGMDGLELGDKLDDLLPGVPVLYVTAYVDKVIDGALCMLPKPFTSDQFRTNVTALLAERAQELAEADRSI